MWSEVQQVREHQRHELTLSGADVAKRIEELGLDDHVYELTTINFLEISKTSMTLLDNRIGQMRNLNRLILYYNKLKELPSGLSKLSKLKFLDVSHNELTELPDVFTTLTDLQSLNANVNFITKVADLSQCVHLTLVDLSFNKLEEFPENLCSGALVNLLEIKLNSNVLKNISPDLVLLSGLKQLDLSTNQITVIPKELSQCPKLKDVLLHDNPIKDSRLNKLTGQKPPKFKAVLDYIRDHCTAVKQETTEAAGKGKGHAGGQKGKKKKDGAGDEEPEVVKDEIHILAAEESTPRVSCKASIQQVRPYIVCCIIKNMKLDSPEQLKKFITIQTEFHDELCEKRTAATIATHDLSLINGNISFEARPPKFIKIQPLKRPNEVTAYELVAGLKQEADAVRKEKKRNTYSGIHKYLNLVLDKPVYPCLVAADGTVISFPPITNSDKTKIGVGTKDVLLEVTSSKSLAICKIVIEKLLLECLKEGLVSSEEASNEKLEGTHTTASDVAEGNAPQILTVQQVRVVDEEGDLRVIYPSRVDLILDNVTVVRG